MVAEYGSTTVDKIYNVQPQQQSRVLVIDPGPIVFEDEICSYNIEQTAPDQHTDAASVSASTAVVSFTDAEGSEREKQARECHAEAEHAEQSEHTQDHDDRLGDEENAIVGRERYVHV